ncbi:transposon Tn916 excisionase [Lachnotalea glycerini]|uniref:Transposon Tn916 excisionase n=1 Tax=Lachnotalea glycerini TaxID=1763509 RepID=A0A318EN03_9FIRM|nr:transposon Tn916 excisionase [Lachnotalea glycerini]
MNVIEENKTINKTNKYGIPLWRKYILSVQEASEYFHIGYKKLRKLIDEHPEEEFILWNGTRPQIKRKLFEQYIDEKLTAI